MNRQKKTCRPRLVHSLVWGLLFAVLVGCSRSRYPETAPVQGTVTLDGKPVEDATVTFAPINSRASSGRTDEQGRYILLFKKGIPGAVLGSHQVKISKFVADNSESAVAYATAMHARQRALDEAAGFVPDEDSSDSIKQPPTGMDLINLLPDRFGGPESILTATVKRRNNVLDFDLSSDPEK